MDPWTSMDLDWTFPRVHYVLPSTTSRREDMSQFSSGPLSRLGDNFTVYVALLAILACAFSYGRVLVRRGDHSWVGRLAWFCVKGGSRKNYDDDDDDSGVEAAVASAKSAEAKAMSENASSAHSAALLLFCACGLQCAYLSWGVLQERLMTRGYGSAGSTFSSSQFLVFCNRTLALSVGLAVVGSGVVDMPSHRTPFFKYSFTSLSNIMSSWCQYEALKYVSFPAQVISKSSKIFPVMFMGWLINHRSYPLYEYAVAGVVSGGVALFMANEKAPKQTELAEQSTQTTGLILLGCYLILDSFTSQWQQHIFRRHKASSYHMMVGVNSFSAFFTFAALLRSGELFVALDFIREFPESSMHVLLLSLAGAIGQMFIFYTIKTFGPLVFAIIMTTRQVLSIMLSSWLYGHTIGLKGIAGATTVFSALIFRIWKKHETRQQNVRMQQRAGSSAAATTISGRSGKGSCDVKDSVSRECNANRRRDANATQQSSLMLQRLK